MNKILQFLAVVVLVIAASYGAQRYLESSQASQLRYQCVSTNQARVTTNVRIHSERQMRDSLVEFEYAAAKARYAAWKQQHLALDLEAARTYNRDAEKLARVPLPYLGFLKCPT